MGVTDDDDEDEAELNSDSEAVGETVGVRDCVGESLEELVIDKPLDTEADDVGESEVVTLLEGEMDALEEGEGKGVGLGTHTSSTHVPSHEPHTPPHVSARHADACGHTGTHVNAHAPLLFKRSVKEP